MSGDGVDAHDALDAHEAADTVPAAPGAAVGTAAAAMHRAAAAAGLEPVLQRIRDIHKIIAATSAARKNAVTFARRLARVESALSGASIPAPAPANGGLPDVPRTLRSPRSSRRRPCGCTATWTRHTP
jgi:hypothetical protein